PPSSSRRNVSRSISVSPIIGCCASPSRAGLSLRFTAENPADAAQVTTSGGVNSRTHMWASDRSGNARCPLDGWIEAEAQAALTPAGIRSATHCARRCPLWRSSPLLLPGLARPRRIDHGAGVKCDGFRDLPARLTLAGHGVEQRRRDDDLVV